MYHFLFALIELFFTIYYSSGVMRRNVYSSAVFTGGLPLALNFYLNRVVPHQSFLASENQRHWATRWWRPHPSAIPRFDTIRECDRQTDRRTDGQTDGYTAHSIQRLQS